MNVIETIREELTQRPSDDQVVAALEDRLGSIDSQIQSVRDRAESEVSALEETRDLLVSALEELTPAADADESVEG